jgi:hypothetical protein
MSETADLAYLAGLFDVAGKVKLASLGSGVPRRLYASLMLVSSPESEELLLDLLLTWKGRVHRSSDRKTWKWQLQTSSAADFLEDVIPHLVLKREQAELAVEWQRNRPGYHREEIRVPDDAIRASDDSAAVAVRDAKPKRVVS